MIEPGYTSVSVHLDAHADVTCNGTVIDDAIAITVYHPHGSVLMWVPDTDEATQYVGAELVRVGLELQQARAPAAIA